MKKIIFATIFALASNVNAGVIDIPSLASTYTGGSTVSTSDVTITNTSGGSIGFGSGASICGFDVNYCIDNLEIEFNNLVSDVQFNVLGWDSTDDIIKARIFDINNSLIDEIDISSNGDYGFSSYDNIHVLAFDPQTSRTGVAFQNIAYTFAPESVSVSEPATLSLILLGLTGISLSRNRRKKVNLQVSNSSCFV